VKSKKQKDDLSKKQAIFLLSMSIVSLTAWIAKKAVQLF